MSTLGRGANKGASEFQECLQGSDRFRIKQRANEEASVPDQPVVLFTTGPSVSALLCPASWSDKLFHCQCVHCLLNLGFRTCEANTLPLTQGSAPSPNVFILKVSIFT